MPSDAPKITILLATYNGADYLRAQLESFRAQTYGHWELLVSDDGSTDETVSIVEAFAAGVSQRVTLLSGPRRGFWQNFAALVRTPGLAGDLFAYSDQDDIWLSDKLAVAVEWFAQQRIARPLLYFTRTELMANDGAPLGFSPLFVRAPTFRNALVQNIGGGNTMVFNRAALDALLATPPHIDIVSHDWWTYQTVTGIGGVAHYDSRPSLRYRQHGQNIVGSNVGWRARLVRLRAFSKGRVVGWNATNIAFLTAIRDRLTPENRATLDRFAAARSGFPPARLWSLWRSGVYRQSRVETLGMFVGALFGRL